MKPAAFTVSILSSKVPQEKTDSIGAGGCFMDSPNGIAAKAKGFSRRNVLHFILGLAMLPIVRTKPGTGQTLIEIDGWILRKSDLA